MLEHKPPTDFVLWPLTNCIVLGSMPTAVRLARRFTTRNLLAWDMPRLADNASLVVSELVTNAIKASWLVHAGTVTVWFWADGRDLLVEVWDASPEPPTPVTEPTDEGGRGLAIVAALCDSWGYYADSRRGKVVWASISSGRL